ncbi:MAG TPA: hypothetical protein VIG08_07950 [Gemmatimonadales bacterium]|jgi:hypothetical protein
MRVLAVPLAASLAVVLAGRAPSAILVTPDARTAMHEMWKGSLESRREAVACLASVIEEDTVRITRIMPLDGLGIDSLAVGAKTSLETCSPPVWQGTVHTHIALYDGRRPYSTFSGADRGVMLDWGQRWNTQGTFCLLFGETMIHCELDGPAGALIFPSTTY